MKVFRKNVNGVEMVLPISKIVIEKNGMATYNPTEEMVIADGWSVYEEAELTNEEILDYVKREKVSDLMRYDSSDAVNDCIIVYQGQELHYWANKTERDALKGALRDCIAMGRDSYRLDLRDKGVSLVLNCELLLQLLAALEVYAIDCYNNTTDHEFAIKALVTREEIEAYDIKVGYPSIPRFEL